MAMPLCPLTLRLLQSSGPLSLRSQILCGGRLAVAGIHNYNCKPGASSIHKWEQPFKIQRVSYSSSRALKTYPVLREEHKPRSTDISPSNDVTKLSLAAVVGTRCFSTNQTFVPSELTDLEYETYSEETLDALAEFFEDLPEIEQCSDDFDCAYGSGVLNIHVGSADGTYVLNKQAPNKQIWLSSPLSGPKRYDYCDGKWIYLRDGKGLHGLLEEELSEILGFTVNLKKCPFYSH